jgi:hypothetical protein
MKKQVLHAKTNLPAEPVKIGYALKYLTLCGHWVLNNKTTENKEIVNCVKCRNILFDQWPKFPKGYNKKAERKDAWPIDRECDI